jgi:uncharacterized membrane protein
MDAYLSLAALAGAGLLVYFGLPWVSALERRAAERRARSTPAE